MSPALTPFLSRHLLLLESYRRDGTAVHTPLLFIIHDEGLYMRTPSATAKVGRIRRNPHVRLAPADWRGRPVGEWLSAEATVYDASEMAWVNERFKQRHGLFKRLIDWRNSFRRPRFVVIEARFSSE
jgi:PPOX class probable F420-dependent enzyme